MKKFVQAPKGMSYALRLIAPSSVRYPTFAVSYLAHCLCSAKLISPLKLDRSALSRHSANVIFPSPLVLAIEKSLLPNHQGFQIDIHNRQTDAHLDSSSRLETNKQTHLLEKPNATIDYSTYSEDHSRMLRFMGPFLQPPAQLQPNMLL